jgi:hypothetical protein
MVLEEGLLFPEKFWSGWEATGWEERLSTTAEVEEEGMSRVVEEITQGVEGEVAMPLLMPPTHFICRGPIQATDRF